MLVIIDAFFWVYMVMLFLRIMSSWLPEYQDHPIVHFIAYYTDPYLNVFRRVIPPLGSVDVSPVVAFFALKIIEGVVKALF